MQPIQNLWGEIVSFFADHPQDIRSAPRVKGRAAIWFHVRSDGKYLYVGRARTHTPSSKLSAERRLSGAELEKVYPVYLRRRRGELTAIEAQNTTHNQVYWYAILDAVTGEGR